ncbi:hypothetical protein PHYBLDRAFT_71504 [Phycomyces blakesleeanus NRRL 1555(-)]|uniref:Uncharacterized protein n=1 Tax=Phycomyces blakesleeanus (strain ATCC 8743b / DSM 1359 / FGSC 10004 / NBRC 33097 / NRRL 1555) TaxID=763407 RepID=A0A162ZZM8_PHYB8|nr:hypothetical protein PHYBLDRAFT_71504 [Phycomyces blakesleeanus NRRL 1555(-)]OAD70061.1 hypothetical protein PHYBLDRAFT_71504 [Phycomyces blakesleeanus NRRL 1555(-)]|eukprot:XP_018288101.1 hypothetical protein PHYBLDRAFT_71504 [Phycomyces blakesleeanus NRRL 1555(-)]
MHFEEYINKIIELDSKQKLENLNDPIVVEAIKDRSKNTKRKMIALEHCLEAEKKETTKKKHQQFSPCKMQTNQKLQLAANKPISQSHITYFQTVETVETVETVQAVQAVPPI